MGHGLSGQGGPDTPGEVDASPAQSTFGTFTSVLNAIGTTLIVLMALAVNADILGRDLFSHPIPGVTEFLGLSIVAVVFLQMANTLREDRHVSNDLIMAAIARRRPRIARLFYALFHLVGAALMFLIVWFVIPTFLENYRGNYYRGTAGYVEIPVWPFMLIVLIGAMTAAVQYALLAVHELRRIRWSESP